LNDAEKTSLVDLAMRILAARHRRGRAIRSPADTEAYLRLRMADLPAERFGCLYLDNRHRVLELRDLFHGTIDGTSVYPRVVVQQALEVNAAAVILFHNHPSGVAEPSQADERITHRLRAALELIDVRVLDHYIVASGASVSMASRGLI
jgi:DNA repair protein RadC